MGRVEFRFVNYLQSLINTSSFTEEKKQELEANLELIEINEANNLLSLLQDNQLNIRDGINYGQREIVRYLFSRF